MRVRARSSPRAAVSLFAEVRGFNTPRSGDAVELPMGMAFIMAGEVIHLSIGGLERGDDRSLCSEACFLLGPFFPWSWV